MVISVSLNGLKFNGLNFKSFVSNNFYRCAKSSLCKKKHSLVSSILLRQRDSLFEKAKKEKKDGNIIFMIDVFIVYSIKKYSY